MFTWIVWTIMTAIAAGGQVVGGAGAGAWALLLTTAYCAIVLIASFKYGEKNITRSDWYFLIGGLSAIPLWAFTSDPTWAVVLVTLIDLSAYGPTIRKSWHKPWEEGLLAYLAGVGKHMATILAIAHYNIATSLFTVALLGANITMVTVLAGRRIYLKSQSAVPVQQE